MPTAKQRVKRISLTKEQVEAVFAQASHQTDYVVGLYTLVYPDFDQLVSVDGFPACGEALSNCIWHAAMGFDKVHHPDVLAGGCWLNHGFATDKALPPWAVSPCPVTRKEEPCN